MVVDSATGSGHKVIDSARKALSRGLILPGKWSLGDQFCQASIHQGIINSAMQAFTRWSILSGKCSLRDQFYRASVHQVDSVWKMFTTGSILPSILPYLYTIVTTEWAHSGRFCRAIERLLGVLTGSAVPAFNMRPHKEVGSLRPKTSRWPGWPKDWPKVQAKLAKDWQKKWPSWLKTG